jgi:hypothetical protein
MAPLAQSSDTIILIVIVAPARSASIAAVLGIFLLARPCLVHVYEREKDLTIELPGDFLQRAGTLGISILKPIPRQPALRVLMVEQVDQPIWRALPDRTDFMMTIGIEHHQGRGKAALRWLEQLKGKKLMQLVGQ